MIVSEFGGAYEVTTSNTADLPQATVALYVGGGPGDIKVTDFQGHTTTFKAVPQGTILPGQFKRIFASGTTATLLVAFTSPGPTVK